MLLVHNYQPQSYEQQRLLKQLRSIDRNIIGIEVAELYFLLSKDDTAETIDIAKVYSLLGIQDTHGGQGWPWQPEIDNLLYVVPRPGTISSWSSKATDIFNICDMDLVARVERGFCYRLRLDARKFTYSDAIKAQLHDRMVETVYSTRKEIDAWLTAAQSHGNTLHNKKVDNRTAAIRHCRTPVSAQRISTFVNEKGNGLGLSKAELSRFAKYYIGIERMPTDTELMMYAQVNSEHCRHKLFNAHWLLNSKLQEHTLFEMIKSTRHALDDVVSAYEDNASVIRHGVNVNRLRIDPSHRHYVYGNEERFYLIKVETHNHPTAISPFPGAATGSGGEIRDESATGQGGCPGMGLVGFSLSNLRIPGFEQPWEDAPVYPAHIASPLQIISEGPLGAARFNNEFGRPCVCGYFRTYEGQAETYRWGYHKPIMIAGGLGSICKEHIAKQHFDADTPLVVFGGPAMRIGLGGGSASSVGGGSASHELDFASVQRDNAEMQRRCQGVIERCTEELNNPIRAVHDVGAGGLANALPELVHGAGRGAHIDLRAIPCADDTLSPMEIWCNESQERYVAAIDKHLLDRFKTFCARERCPMAVVGQAVPEQTLVLEDRFYPEGTPQRMPVDIPMAVLFEKPSDDQRPLKQITRMPTVPRQWQDIDLDDAVERVLKMPAVASKSFLITIGDRSVGGLIHRDQMVGPWQVPVSDVAVSLIDYTGNSGEAMAMGERTPVAVLDAAASGRLAVAEAILNISAADIRELHHICFSANWMAACDSAQQRFDLYNIGEGGDGSV